MGNPPKRDPYGLIGTSLDRYEIKELVGMGGTGVVYRAEHSVTGRVFAVKVLKPDLGNNSDTAELFIAEARKTRALIHPHIVNILDAGVTEEGWTFIAMEWLEGIPLADEIKNNGPLPFDRIANLLDQICDGVHHAHENNLIHRDLKPGNIMLIASPQGTDAIKILDFGVAKALSATASANSMVVGTSYYVPPEQWIYNAKIDRRADVYSIGVILYQLLTGRVPFDAESYGQLMYQHLHDPPPPLREARQDIPEPIEEVVLKSMAKKPEDRYSNALELARAFRQSINFTEGGIFLECLDNDTESSIAGASIYLNGRHVGQTDERGQWIKNNFPPKKYAIEVVCLNYQDWQQSVSIHPNQEMAVTVKLLRKNEGELIISCGVAGAEILVGEKSVGSTDETGRLYIPSLRVGNYSIKVTHPKYLIYESETKIKLGQQSFLNISLEPRPKRQTGLKLYRAVMRGLAGIGSGLGNGLRNIGRAVSSKYVIRGVGSLLILAVLTGAIIGARKLMFRPVPTTELTIHVYGLFPNGEKTPLAESLVEYDGKEARTNAAGWLIISNLTKKRIALKISKSGYEELSPEPIELNTEPITKEFMLPIKKLEGMVLLMGGEFEMGQENGDEYDRPVYRATVKPFYLDITEVTNEAYKKFVNEHPEHAPESWHNKTFPIGEENFPVTDVTWEDADAYAKWIHKRLPTEEEWEFAARGGKEKRLYPWGNTYMPDYANLATNRLANVKDYPQGVTPEGIYNLIGNAWEWTASDFEPYPGGKNPMSKEFEGLPLKVIRGGGYQTTSKPTATFRRAWSPTRKDWPPKSSEKEKDYSQTGFRCAQDFSF